MSRKMLINARTPEELRIVIIEGDNLENYQVEVAERGLTRGNIYRGTIVSIQPSLNAAFIDYGAERDGFLPTQDVVPEAYYRKPKSSGRAKVEEVLEKGRSIIVQVVKEPVGTKGAALTTSLSLAGRYLVLTPFDEVQGVSRKVEDDETRRSLKDQATKLRLPPGCGVIVRTNALGQNKAALNRDANALLRLWKRVGSEARKGKGTKLIYSDQDLILRVLRDYLDSSITEVLTDDDRSYTKVEEYMRAFMPRTKTRLVRYEKRAPLFSSFGLEQQIERIYDRSVDLPNGGSIVIDATEALVAVDVNSGRATRAKSQEETALNTNLEAAHEVARQLRLRDIGGLIVVDFIDMRSRKNQHMVQKALREALKVDKARTTVGRISDNGLLEINRQRIQQALHLRTHRPCPTCHGTGRIPSPEMVGLNLLRRIESRASTLPTERVRIALHPELADAFQNNRRQEITRLQEEFELKVEVIASNRLHRADQEIEWFDRAPQERRQQVSRRREKRSVPRKADHAPTSGDTRPKTRIPSEKASREGQAASRDPGSSETPDKTTGSSEKRPRARRRPSRRRRGRKAASKQNAEPSSG